jgi:hypothetical protein
VWLKRVSDRVVYPLFPGGLEFRDLLEQGAQRTAQELDQPLTYAMSWILLMDFRSPPQLWRDLVAELPPSMTRIEVEMDNMSLYSTL